MKKHYLVALTDGEQRELLALIRRGADRARRINRAHILLLAHDGKTDAGIANALHTSESTVRRIRRRYAEAGLPGALAEEHRPGRRRKLSREQEAGLVALAATPPPGGGRAWTAHLLASRAVALGIVEDVSRETVRRVLKQRAEGGGEAHESALGPAEER